MITIIPNWHPIFVHFTVAILVITGLLQLILWFFNDKLKLAGVIFVQKWLVILGSLAILATIATGLLAYYSVAHDTPSHLAMTDHRNWALTTAVIFLIGAILFYLQPGRRQLLAGSCFVAAFLLVSITAFKGGELVYRHGLGVMSLPQVSGEGHDHEHPDGGHEQVDKQTDAGESASHQHDAKPAGEETSNKTEHEHSDNGHEHTSQDPLPAETIKPAEHEHSHDQTEGHHQQVSSEMFSGLNSEAAKTVIAFHAAINSGDAVQARMLLDDAVVIFEGGGVERSADQYASHHMKSDMAFLANMKITSQEHQVKTMTDMAISIARNNIQGMYKDKNIDINSMETIVLKKTDGNWRIIHIHWSN